MLCTHACAQSAQEASRKHSNIAIQSVSAHTHTQNRNKLQRADASIQVALDARIFILALTQSLALKASRRIGGDALACACHDGVVSARLPSSWPHQGAGRGRHLRHMMHVLYAPMLRALGWIRSELIVARYHLHVPTWMRPRFASRRLAGSRHCHLGSVNR